MPIDAKEKYKPFEIKVDELNAIRIKHETLLINETLDDFEVEQMYAGLFLSLFTEFEGLLENLFFGLLKDEIVSTHPFYKKLITVEPLTSIEKVVFGEKNKYLDWLPLQNCTYPRAKIYFQDGIPFTLITERNMSNLTTFQLIRNAIAHKSNYSLQRFRNDISNLTLLPREKEPAAFLRSVPNRRLNKTQYEIASDELKAIVMVICQ